MNKKAVVLLVMMCMIAVLLVMNLFILKGREDETELHMDNDTHNVSNVEDETETVTSEVEKEVSSGEPDTHESSPFVITVLTGEVASSLAAELESVSGGQSVTFINPDYYNSEKYSKEVKMP